MFNTTSKKTTRRSVVAFVMLGLSFLYWAPASVFGYQLVDVGGHAFAISSDPSAYSFALDADGDGMSAYVSAYDGGNATGYYNRTIVIVPEAGDTTRVVPVSVQWDVEYAAVNSDIGNARGAADILFLDGTFRFYEVIQAPGPSTSVSRTVTLYTNTRYLFEVDAQVNTVGSSGVVAENMGYAHLSFPPEILDAPPTIGDIATNSTPAPVNTAIAFSATFGYPDVGQSFAASWDWGDGTSSAGAVGFGSGTGQASDQHAYSSAGVYTVGLTITDGNGLSSTRSYQYVVVYDATAGFVTGGGWIDSPAGAFQLDPTLVGMGSFGFVSKYQKGANVPTGQTAFSFIVANLAFTSTSYDWLVISGGKATYKGSGVINGTGNYKFLLSAIDGGYSGKGNLDQLRIKIWNASSGDIVYDNQVGSPDGADPSTTIGAGSIVIHQ